MKWGGRAPLPPAGDDPVDKDHHHVKLLVHHCRMTRKKSDVTQGNSRFSAILQTTIRIARCGMNDFCLN